uniref:Uncharacterized protein n=1 Tax=Romanomermis culicivorax TaxID=13658 RepID=A0A915I6A1_ROMCU
MKRLAIGGEVMYFECVSCSSHGDPMGRATVPEGRVQSNPDHGHNPLCVPPTRSKVKKLNKSIQPEKIKQKERKVAQNKRNI